jgi:hypothetical protein
MLERTDARTNEVLEPIASSLYFWHTIRKEPHKKMMNGHAQYTALVRQRSDGERHWTSLPLRCYCYVKLSIYHDWDIDSADHERAQSLQHHTSLSCGIISLPYFTVSWRRVWRCHVALYSGRNSPTFQMCLLSLSSGHRQLKYPSMSTRLQDAASHKTAVFNAYLVTETEEK